MPLWGGSDVSSNTPKTKILVPTQVGGNTANGTALYQNVTYSNFANGQVLGLYGVSAAMVSAGETNTGHTTRFLTPGWTTVKQGVGPLLSMSVGMTNTVTGYVITANGLSYNNTDTVIVQQASSGNATYHPVTNATGGVLSLKLINGGYNWQNTTIANVYVANSTNATAASNTSLGSALALTISLTPTVLGKVGQLYVNNEQIKVSNGVTGYANATANIVTDANGSITGFISPSYGNLFVNISSAVITWSNSSSALATNTANGSGANVVFTYGGRMGRIQRESLVTMSITSTQNTPLFPNV